MKRNEKTPVSNALLKELHTVMDPETPVASFELVESEIPQGVILQLRATTVDRKTTLIGEIILKGKVLVTDQQYILLERKNVQMFCDELPKVIGLDRCVCVWDDEHLDIDGNVTDRYEMTFNNDRISFMAQVIHQKEKSNDEID